MSELSPDEKELARERIRAWAPSERRELVRLTPREVDLIGVAVVELDIAPGAPSGADIIEVGLR